MAKRKITIVATKVGDKMIAAPLGSSAKRGTNIDLSGYAKKGHTHAVDDITDLERRLAEIASDGELTVIGKSAFETWLELPGNAGKSETEFIESLKSTEPGPKGDPGRDAETPDLSNYATKSYVSSEIEKIPTGGEGGPVDWADIQNVPETFPAAQHTHHAGEIFGISDHNGYIGVITAVSGQTCRIKPHGNVAPEFDGCLIITKNPGVGDVVSTMRQAGAWYGHVIQRSDGADVLPPSGDTVPVEVSIFAIYMWYEYSDPAKCFTRSLSVTELYSPYLEFSGASISVEFEGDKKESVPTNNYHKLTTLKDFPGAVPMPFPRETRVTITFAKGGLEHKEVFSYKFKNYVTESNVYNDDNRMNVETIINVPIEILT